MKSGTLIRLPFAILMATLTGGLAVLSVLLAARTYKKLVGVSDFELSRHRYPTRFDYWVYSLCEATAIIHAETVLKVIFEQASDIEKHTIRANAQRLLNDAAFYEESKNYMQSLALKYKFYINYRFKELDSDVRLKDNL